MDALWPTIKYLRLDTQHEGVKGKMSHLKSIALVDEMKCDQL